MELSKYRLSARNRIVTVLLVLFAMLIMVTPAFANTSNWAFQGTWDGNVINGKANGVFHNMTAGNLTYSGGIWPTSCHISCGSPHSWTFDVWRDNGWWPDTQICSYSPVTPSTTIGQVVYFSTNCGTITAASDYYVYGYRSTTDGRAISGSGSLVTP